MYQEGCSELCPMIENSWETYENREEILKNHISTFPETVDTVVLGCTHYPIIREDIAKLFTKTIAVSYTHLDVYKRQLFNSSNVIVS